MNSTHEKKKNLGNGRKRNKIPVTWSPEKQTNKKLRQGTKIIMNSMQTLKHGWILASGVKELKQTTKLVQFTDFKVKYWFCANRNNNNNHIKKKKGQILNAWRSGRYTGTCWCFPFARQHWPTDGKCFCDWFWKKKKTKKKNVFMSASPSRRCSGGKKIKMLVQAVFWGWRRRDVI